MTGKGCFVRHIPADAGDITTGIVIIYKSPSPPFRMNAVIGQNRPEDIQHWKNEIEGCIQRNKRVFIPIGVIRYGVRMGHMNGIIIDPRNRCVFYYEPLPYIFANPTGEEYFTTILNTIKTSVLNAIPLLNEYEYRIPDLSPQSCQRSLQSRMTREVNPTDTNCQYYTLLALISFLMNDILPLDKVLERLHRLETEEIRRSIIILQQKFITWIFEQYTQFYSVVSQNPSLVGDKLPLELHVFREKLMNPADHKTESFVYSFRMFRMYLYRIVQ